MNTETFIEDIFIKFAGMAQCNSITIQSHDHSPVDSFFDNITHEKELTASQGRFILSILSKYKLACKIAGYDYSEQLTDPVWKRKFRILDVTKNVFVETDDKGILWVCFKFPYNMQEEFGKSIASIYYSPAGRMAYDAETRVRKIKLYKHNLIQINDFVQEHNFIIDKSFADAAASVEDIWLHSDNVLPSAKLLDGKITLTNAPDCAIEYFNTHSTGNIINDGLLAKSMGYTVTKSINTTTISEKIMSSSSNIFWIKNNKDLFSVYKEINGKVVIIIDRASDIIEWITEFVKDADTAGIDRKDVRVCFREPKTGNISINDCIQQLEVGGKVGSARILIFDTKPAKWLFNDTENVRLLVTNNLYPQTNNISKDWFNSHPCSIYLSKYKPSRYKEQQIVEL